MPYDVYMHHDEPLSVLELSDAPYSEQLCAATLQGLVNRDGPRIFIDFGVYDSPLARQTNEVFIDDEAWFSKFRSMVGKQDRLNLEYYRQEHSFLIQEIENLDALIADNLDTIKGCVIWDEGLPDTVNIALMIAARDNLLPITAEMAERMGRFGLPICHDLCGRWPDRLALYQWAFDELWPICAKGVVACVEPGWHRPEFVDYIVQNRMFVYSLAGGIRGLGSSLLMLLAFGPSSVREVVFALRLDGPIRWLGLLLMGFKSKEVRLSNRIQKAVQGNPYPTIFGWHTKRDDELAFMLQLSSNGLRLVPSHLAGNFSFHSRVKPLGATARKPKQEFQLDPKGTYITCTLSDGDQLMMMNTAELGNWYSPVRGSIPFNWEVQPLLVELAPALLERFTRQATPRDCLVAGPSGAGYIVPPLCPSLARYMKETVRICGEASIDIVTSYVADPPMRVLRTMARNKGHLAGFLCGYAVVDRAPQLCVDDSVFVSNEIPAARDIHDAPDALLARLKEKIESPDTLPRFIGVHLFAYRTGIDDIARFMAGFNDSTVHFVAADEFLSLAGQYYSRKNNEQERT